MPSSRGILGSIVLVGVFVVASKAFGAVREIVLAAKFGTNEIIDAYLLMFSFASWPVAVWLSALTVVAVPLLVRGDKASPDLVRQFVFELSVVSVLVGGALSVAFWIGISLFASSSSLGLSAVSAALVHDLAGPMSLILPTGLLVGTFSIRLLACNRHVGTLLEGVPALFVSAAALTFVSQGLSVIVWGTVAGFAAQAFALYLFFPRAQPGLPVRMRLSSPMWRPFIRAFGLVALGQLIISSTGVIDQIMVAGLGVGAIAVLGYVNRILALLLGLGATAVARATLPAFSALAVDNQSGMVHAAKFWMKILFGFGAAIAVVGWILTPWAVQAFFERGMFTSEDTAAVSDVLRFGLLQLPFYFSSIVAVQVLAARGQAHRITQVGLVNVVVKVVANYFLIHAFGMAGVMMATAVTYALALPLLVKFATRES